MSISVNLLLFVAGVGILQTVLLACVIYFHPKSDRSVCAFLALYIFFYSIPTFTPLVQHFFSWQYLILIDPFPLLIGPFLYLYIRSFKETITLRKAWPHFVLFALYVLLDSQLYLNFSARYPSSHEIPAEVVHNPASMIRVFIRIAQKVVYYFLASRALTSYQRSIQHLFSETSKISLDWVRWLVNGYIFLVLLMLGLYFLILQSPEHFRLIILINTAIVAPYMYMITFKGVTQPTLWQAMGGMNKEKVQLEMHDVEELELPSALEERKSAKLSISKERTAEIVSQTLALMEDEKLFQQTELTLQDLADRLKIPSYQVSVAINEGIKKTFYDLVNGYRVEEAKRLLMDPKNRNNKILTVGFDAGFNSKTTFNTVFKKFTGLTPSDFRDQYKAELVNS